MALREVTLDNGAKCRVADNGEVYSLDHTSIRKNGRADNRKGKCLKPKIDRYGYKVVTLTNKENRKSIPVHRLVALAYIPNPEGKETVNHIDGNKLNNNVSNLEWATQKEQKRHAMDHHLCDNHIIALIKANKKKSVSMVVDGVRYESIKEAVRVTKRKEWWVRKYGER